MKQLYQGMVRARAFEDRMHSMYRSGDLLGALRKALDEKGPSLVVIPIDYRENALLTKKLGEVTATI